MYASFSLEENENLTAEGAEERRGTSDIFDHFKCRPSGIGVTGDLECFQFNQSFLRLSVCYWPARAAKAQFSAFLCALCG